jgi:hypothetical protein
VALTAIASLAVAGVLAPTGGAAARGAPGRGATAPYARKLPPLLTPWTRSVSARAPLPQYPRPQLERARWLNLNGQWQYQRAHPGQAPPFGRSLAQTILVPFPVQSPLSGIERGDEWGWYRRTFAVPSSWAGKRVLLNFGAVSWQAIVYVNGRRAGSHRGDYDSFSFDVTKLLHRRGSNVLLVGFHDPIGADGEPVGKQIPGPARSIYHTASSGIWQTVWLEPVSADHVTALELVPDLEHSRLLITAFTTGRGRAALVAKALAGGRVVATATGSPGRPFSLPVPSPHLWSPSDPYLYGLRIRLVAGGRVRDDVSSYFGMRSVTLGQVGGATRILLNGRFLFETGALDQGYWPDGLYAPPTDAAIRYDMRTAKDLGFNLLRAHQKIESDRWYYWADRLGLLVWQDMPQMDPPGPSPRPRAELPGHPAQIPRAQAGLLGHPAPSPRAQAEFRRELRAVVLQHRSHPSIVMWVPFNEGWEQFDAAAVTREVKSLQSTALVDSDSGSANCCNAVEPPNSDVNDTHLYSGPFSVNADSRATVVGEYGGVLSYPPKGHRWPGVLTSIGLPVAAWGQRPVIEILEAQYGELAQEMRLLGLSGSVFTELSGYEGELGILTYDRRRLTMPAATVRALNDALVAASQGPEATLQPQPPAIPPGTAGLWRFSEGTGTQAADSSGNGHTLTLTRGAGWTASPFGGALSIGAPGQAAVSAAPLIDTGRSFAVSAWLSYARPGESGTAVSEPGPDGSAFSLGIETSRQGSQSLGGVETGRQGAQLLGGLPGGASLRPATRWTLIVPASSSCASIRCGVRANLRYDDGRFDPRPGSWHQLTAVYDAGTATITLYDDGVPEDVEHVFGVPRATGPLTVGAGAADYSPTDAFIGAIAELRIYARALTPAEAWQLYAAERPPALARVR